MPTSNFTLINETEAKLPPIDFDALKIAALGAKYELMLIVTTPARIKKLNTIYRDIEKPTDILSFPLSKNEGEMYISPIQTRAEAKKFDRDYENFFAFLFIHGCVHLKGYDHSSRMEAIEKKIRTKFGV